MTKLLRAAVIGAGRMGSHHARILASLPGVELCAIIDHNANKAARLAANYGAASGTDPQQLIGKIDCATIAAPSSRHAEIGLLLLSAGISCLIEKPLALTEADCVALIAAARQHHAHLAVGHVERFNPAFIAAAEWLVGKRIIAIDARRMNPGSNRILDNDVISDLMVHDLDAIVYLVNRDQKRSIVQLAAQGICGVGSNLCDQAIVQMGFAPINPLQSNDQNYGQNIMVSLAASRITHNRVRDVSILTDQGLLCVDYLAGQAKIFRSQDQDARSAKAGVTPIASIRVEPLLIRAAEPLTLEIGQFVRYVIAHGTNNSDNAASANGVGIGVTGEEALATLQAIWAIGEKIAESRSVL